MVGASAWRFASQLAAMSAIAPIAVTPASDLRGDMTLPSLSVDLAQSRIPRKASVMPPHARMQSLPLQGVGKRSGAAIARPRSSVVGPWQCCADTTIGSLIRPALVLSQRDRGGIDPDDVGPHRLPRLPAWYDDVAI